MERYTHLITWILKFKWGLSVTTEPPVLNTKDERRGRENSFLVVSGEMNEKGDVTLSKITHKTDYLAILFLDKRNGDNVIFIKNNPSLVGKIKTGHDLAKQIVAKEKIKINEKHNEENA